MSQNEGGQTTESNDTGFNANADFYSLLNLPPTAGVKQIENSFKKLSRSIHPDKYRPAE